MMKTLAVSAVVLLALASFASAESTHYPLLVWNSRSNLKTAEFDMHLSGSQAAEKIFEHAFSEDVDLAVVLVKEGMSTSNLLAQAGSLNFIKDRVLSKAQVYVNVADEFLGSSLNSHLKYDLATNGEIESLTKIMMRDVMQLRKQQSGEKELITVLINMHSSLSVSDMDGAVRRFENAIKIKKLKVAMAIVGKSAEQGEHNEKLFSFQQASLG